MFYNCNKQTAISLTSVSRCKQQTKKGGTSQGQTHATRVGTSTMVESTNNNNKYNLFLITVCIVFFGAPFRA